jgi:serine/threonine protein kinase
LTILCWHSRCAQPENPDTATVCQHCGHALLLSDRYRIQRVIGQGGFGRTLLATDLHLSPPRPCIIKQHLPPKLAGDLAIDWSARFQQEAERLRVLGEHPQIPALLDFFEVAGEQFLVQAYIPGDNLEQQLAQGCFTEAQVRKLLQDILPVLQFVHDHQVIHRDVKPANLIAPPDGRATVLVDFGASKYAQHPDVLGKTGTVIGSPGYVAPEQALGKAVFASDLYSLGVTCIHLLTGVHPFDLYSITSDRWQWREAVQSPVSLVLARILDRMLARGLRERYATVTEVLADLNRKPQLGPGKRRSPTQEQQRKTSLKVENPQIVGHCQQVLPHPQTLVTALAISPNGRAIATGTSDRVIRLWDAATGELLHSFTKRLGFWGQGHSDRLVGLAFSPNGQFLYSSSQDGDIRCWDLATYQLVYRLESPGWLTTTALLTLDGTLLISGGGDGRIQLWDAAQRQLLHTLGHHQDRVTSLAISPDSQQLFSGSWDATVRLWDLPSGRLRQTLTAPTHKITALAYTAASQQIISGDATGQVMGWAPQQASQGLPLTALGSEITALATTDRHPWVAMGSSDGTLIIWDVQQRIPIGQLRHSWGVRQAIFAATSDRLITSSDDETVRIWTIHPA